MIVCGLFLVLAPYNQMFGVLLGFCEVIRHGQWERGQTDIEYKNQISDIAAGPLKVAPTK